MQNLMICNLVVNFHCPNRPKARLQIVVFTGLVGETWWHSWLRHCATNQKVAGWNFSLT